MHTPKLTVLEKVGFGAGDMAVNVVIEQFRTSDARPVDPGRGRHQYQRQQQGAARVQPGGTLHAFR